MLLQCPLALFLGHYYDIRVFMGAGYLVSSGLNPYGQYDLSGVFQHPIFNGTVPGIGYPPPWPMLLGLMYRLSFNLVPNLLLYNFALKVPVILGNIGLAYLVRLIVIRSKVERRRADAAWLFILFNPLVLLTTAAWGQFDTVVVLLALASLYLLRGNRPRWSAILLAISVSLKPIGLPLIPLPPLYLSGRRRSVEYLLIFAATLLISAVAPFYVLGWSPQPILDNWNAHFTVAGGMSPLNILEIVEGSNVMPSALGVIGFLWVPVLMVGYYFINRNCPRSTEELVGSALAVTLVFFLTRTWLSEPNIDLILPMMLVLVGTGRMRGNELHVVWITTLAFMFLNTSIQQLFALVYPPVMTLLADTDLMFREARLVARFLIVIPWQIVGWMIVVKLLRPGHRTVGSSS
jgi:hypothetical protein